MKRAFQAPKPLPGDSPKLDALIQGASPDRLETRVEPPAPPPEPPRPALTLTSVPTKELPGSFLLRFEGDEARLFEQAFAQLPYKNRQLMVKDVLFSELKRRLGLWTA